MSEIQEESFDPVAFNLKRWSDFVSNELILKSRWAWRANCYELSPSVMYPSTDHGQSIAADKHCSGCEVKRECLFLALCSKEGYGVWGGTTEAERSDLLKLVDEVFDPKDFTDSSCIEPILDVVDSYLQYRSSMSHDDFEVIKVKEIL